MGVTTVEGKSGYGLDKETELLQLRVMRSLNNDEHKRVDIVPTFLGAHAVPQEYNGRTDDYVDFIIREVMPAVVQNRLAEFCDVFCEQGVFSIGQSRRLLTAAREMGLALKLHADEIVPLGGAGLAAELSAVSAASSQFICLIAEDFRYKCACAYCTGVCLADCDDLFNLIWRNPCTNCTVGSQCEEDVTMG